MEEIEKSKLIEMITNAMRTMPEHDLALVACQALNKKIEYNHETEKFEDHWEEKEEHGNQEEP